jgi:hypothetical protein
VIAIAGTSSIERLRSTSSSGSRLNNDYFVCPPQSDAPHARAATLPTVH